MWAKETRICKTQRVEDLRVNDNEWQRAKDKFSLNVYDLVAKKKKKNGHHNSKEMDNQEGRRKGREGFQRIRSSVVRDSRLKH